MLSCVWERTSCLILAPPAQRQTPTVMIMKTRQRLRSLALLSALAVAVPAPLLAQGVGTNIPQVELEDFTQTKAKSYDDLFGRAVLFEFFAYW
ncbi:MAG: hypothetical protein ACI841_003557 [Planctomycetota bacterium]|jgi:hypothetical protein